MVLAMVVVFWTTPYEAVVGVRVGRSVPDDELLEFADADQLRAAFNADKGHPRLILLVAPT